MYSIGNHLLSLLLQRNSDVPVNMYIDYAILNALLFVTFWISCMERVGIQKTLLFSYSGDR